jgi:hypothetical protein
MAGRIPRVMALALVAMGLAGCRLDHQVSPPGPDPLPPGDGYIAGRYTARSGPIFATPAADPGANRAVHALVENIRHTPAAPPSGSWPTRSPSARSPRP